MTINAFKEFAYKPPVVLDVKNIAQNPVGSMQQQNDSALSKKSKRSFNQYVLIPLALCGVAIGGILYAGRTGKLGQKVSSAVLDPAYKTKLVQGLKDKFNINIKPEHLNSIMGPEEFSQTIGKYKPENFQAGVQGVDLRFGDFKEYKDKFLKEISDVELEKFYKNSIDGNFRISTHTHSNFSDGKATPLEFLECARAYADKVAKKRSSDGLPPFTIALTDHDNVEGAQEIVKLIAQNPKKYKNLKFVVGCEFSTSTNISGFNKHHDVTGLALNPFDESLNKMLNDLRDSRRKIVTDFLNDRPDFNGKKLTLSDLIDWEKTHSKKGKRTVENGSGIVSVRHAIKYYFEKINEADLNNAASDAEKKGIKQSMKNEMNYLMNKLGDTHILPTDYVVKTVKENGGHASLTHPLKSFYEYIGDETLLAFKEMGIDGIEVNHQYTPSKIYEIKAKGYTDLNPNEFLATLTEKYRDFAVKNDMFLSGGTDSHEMQIFSREPSLVGKDEVLNKILK